MTRPLARSLALLSSSFALASCCFGGGGVPALTEDTREVPFGADMQRLVDAEMATLGGAPTPAEWVCGTSGWDLGESPLHGPSYRPMGAGSVVTFVGAILAVETRSAGHPGQGMTIHLLLEPGGRITWTQVGPETPAYGSTAPDADPAWLATHLPSIDGLIARTVDGLGTCSLPRGDVGLLARISTADGATFDPASLAAALPCRGPNDAAPPPQQLHRMEVIGLFENGTYHPVVHSAVGPFGAGGTDYHTCFAVSGVR